MAGAREIRAGRASVQASLDDKLLMRGLAAASGRLKAWGASLSAIGSKMAMMGGAGLAALFGASKLYSDIGSDLLDASGRTGASVEAYGELAHAAEQAGASAEEMEKGMLKGSKLVSEAASGNKAAIQTLNDLGFSAADLANSTPDEILVSIGAALNDIENPAKRSALAMEALGKSGVKLLPMFADGVDGINAMAQEYRDIGGLTTEEAIQAEKFGDELSLLWKTIKFGVAHIGGALVPAISSLVNWITNAAKAATAWIRENQGVIVGVGIAVAVFTGLGVAIAVLGGIISTVGTAIGVLAIGVKVVIVAFKVLWATMHLVMGAVAVAKILCAGFAVAWGVVTAAVGLFNVAMAVAAIKILLVKAAIILAGLAILGIPIAIVAAIAATSGAFDGWGQMFTDLAGTAKEAFGGIMAAMKMGDFAAAGQIAWAALKVVWAQGTSFLLDKWQSFVDQLWHVFEGAMAGLTLLWVEFKFTMQSGWQSIMDFLVAGFVSVAKKAKDFLGEDTLRKLSPELADAAGVDEDKLAQKQEMDRFNAKKAHLLEQKKLVDEVNAAKDARAEHRAGVRDKDKEEIDKLMAELAALSDQAKAAAQPIMDAHVADFLKRPKDNLALPGALGKADVAGTFSAQAAALIGAKSLDKEMLEVQKRIAENTDPKNRGSGPEFE